VPGRSTMGRAALALLWLAPPFPLALPAFSLTGLLLGAADVRVNSQRLLAMARVRAARFARNSRRRRRSAKECGNTMEHGFAHLVLKLTPSRRVGPFDRVLVAPKWYHTLALTADPIKQERARCTRDAGFQAQARIDQSSNPRRVAERRDRGARHTCSWAALAAKWLNLHT
jgi:hypothetical protein